MSQLLPQASPNVAKVEHTTCGVRGCPVRGCLIDCYHGDEVRCSRCHEVVKFVDAGYGGRSLVGERDCDKVDQDEEFGC